MVMTDLELRLVLFMWVFIIISILFSLPFVVRKDFHCYVTMLLGVAYCLLDVSLSICPMLVLNGKLITIRFGTWFARKYNETHNQPQHSGYSHTKHSVKFSWS